ncbi:TrkH family potassium uptake protein [Pukyongiella litopenaei]|uniref:Trk system potassium uptake protein n=1 Tax=Pukyongiella litopenaei TaxID=2605946 RepID=A0A2S0MM24_9RHOB|nr:TrkH family potassium uptake protein [Pukyongiella litopenaei]AVO36938.1 TrkH family potassium uptake protein [Pukyongiella litopenaei]
MLDLRPVGFVIGLLVAILGAMMAVPLLFDLAEGRGHWGVFLQSGIITVLSGGLLALSCANGRSGRLTTQQTFILVTAIWIALPLFGGLPLMLGETRLNYTDAFFEAMSGLTTTGATVITGLDDLPQGVLLWRSILQWLGGIGIIVMAMVFLPELGVGGMQVFKSEAFDTGGKILPRATEISRQISWIYIGLTAVCALCYATLGMSGFDAVVHALTTVSTGGFSSYDASFGTFSGPMEYVASVFMILAALPFVRYVQLVNGGSLRQLLRDSQVRAFLGTITVLVVIATMVLTTIFPRHPEHSFREALFNITSIISGTGYASADYMTWGPFLIMMFFFVGLIGGCAGSTACSIKIFRYQILFASIRAQVRRIRMPHGVFIPRFQGQKVTAEVLDSVTSFLVFFVVTLGIVSWALALTGEDFITSVSGAATALANIGPGLGDKIGPTGNFAEVNPTAKWILSVSMLIGRLELLAVYVMFTLRFWRA